MKNIQVLLGTLLLLIVSIHSYGQAFSRQVTPYIAIQDATIALTNVTLIDGTGNAVNW